MFFTQPSVHTAGAYIGLIAVASASSIWEYLYTPLPLSPHIERMLVHCSGTPGVEFRGTWRQALWE